MPGLQVVCLGCLNGSRILKWPTHRVACSIGGCCKYGFHGQDACLGHLSLAAGHWSFMHEVLFPVHRCDIFLL